MYNKKIIEGDVLIIGAGAAGLRAAIAAKNEYADGNIILITKSDIDKSGATANAYSDRMAFQATLPHTLPDNKDKYKIHADDIYLKGGRVSDRNLAMLHARKSEKAYEYLDSLGVPFEKDEYGLPKQFMTDYSSYNRAVYTGPNTAVDIKNKLLKKCYELNINIIENCSVIKLTKDSQNKINGAVGIAENYNKKIINFSVTSVVIATGGAGGLYKINAFPYDVTGSGYSLAYNIGAKLVNMEFIQMLLMSMETKIVCSGSIMRSLPRVINSKGEEIVYKYYNIDNKKLMNLMYEKGFNFPASSEHDTSIIDIAIFKEILKGEKVYLDFKNNIDGYNFKYLNDSFKKYYENEKVNENNLSDIPINRLKSINPKVLGWFKNNNLDLEKIGKIRIAPAIQHFQGGIKINKNAKTNIDGLFAAGEAAGGQHGANRPGGNALLDCIVFGEIAGKSAGEYAKRNKVKESNYLIDEIINDFKFTNSNSNINEIRLKLKKIMYNNCGLIKNEKLIDEGIDKINKLISKEKYIKEENLGYAIETNLMLTLSKIILETCKERKESRGPHLYFKNTGDLYPKETDSSWDKYIVVFKNLNNELDINIEEPIRSYKL
ncbi:MAG: FAD-binding protein [Halanaerobiales bacterium]